MCRNWDTYVVAYHWFITGTYFTHSLGGIHIQNLHQIIKALVYFQYLKHYRPIKNIPIFERFPVLICVAAIWIYSIVLTAGGAYKDRPAKTQDSCRTDRANLISSASW